MPIKKPTVKQLSKELQDEQVRVLHLKEENQILKKELDSRQDRYNMIDCAAPAQPRSFLTKESKRKIYLTSELQQFVAEIYDKGIGIIGNKNHDYGDHKNADPFGNFRRHGLKGFLVRIDDKLSRLNTFADCGRLIVTDESTLDTIIDAANYLAIMAAFMYNESLPEKDTDKKYVGACGH